MKFGLELDQQKFIYETVVEPLSLLQARVYCYGSRARGDHHKFSDLDLMVESSEDLSSQISLIQETLAKSSFPFKVDIVQLSEFAPSYKKSYEKDKLLWNFPSLDIP